MKRTTSLTEFSADVAAVLDGAPPPPPAVHQQQDAVATSAQQHRFPAGPVPMEGVAMPVLVEQGFGGHRLPEVGGGDCQKQQQHHHVQQFPLPLIHQQHQLVDVRYSAAATAMVSPRRPRRNSGDFQLETAHFLKACGLCNRRLRPGKDIYMYRGEIAFCSSECRQQQMALDERKEKKCSTASEPSGETIAAA